jgi:glyoxylase-like metal-dependent hydrolase (beta-lactamase superfamily II)
MMVLNPSAKFISRSQRTKEVITDFKVKRQLKIPAKCSPGFFFHFTWTSHYVPVGTSFDINLKVLSGCTTMTATFEKRKTGIMLDQISEHIWLMPGDYTTDRPTLGLVYGGKTSLMVDAGNSPDHISYFYGNLRSMGLADPSYVVVTHWHWDHVFGLAGSPAKSISHTITNDRLNVMQRWDWSDASLNTRVAAGVETQISADTIRKEMPIRHSFKVKPVDITFEKLCEVRLEEVTCEFIHVGGPHSEDSVIVYVPNDKVLFLGDCFSPDHYNNNSLRVAELSPLIKQLETFDVEWMIPSHEAPLSKKDLITRLKADEKIGKLVGTMTDESKILKKLTTGLKREPTVEELETAGFFVAGNTSSGRNSLDRQFLIK